MKLFRRPQDPVVAGFLTFLVAATVAALFALPGVVHADRKDAWDLVVKSAGGLLVVMSSYFAARTLLQSRSDQRLGRILQAAELLGAEKPAVVRVAAVGVLADVAANGIDVREAVHAELILDLLGIAQAGGAADLHRAIAEARERIEGAMGCGRVRRYRSRRREQPLARGPEAPAS